MSPDIRALNWMDLARALQRIGLYPISCHAVFHRDGVACCTCRRGHRCVTPGKHPVGMGWQSQSPEDALALLERYQDRNVGHATGTISQSVIIDVDEGLRQLGSGETVIKKGRETLISLEKRLGPLPPTVTWMTGSGTGEQRLFKVPPGVVMPRNSAGRLGEGLDIRGEGGLGVLPPSNHKSGGRYRWRDGLAPGEVEIAMLPAAWLDALLALGKKPKPATRKTKPKPTVGNEPAPPASGVRATAIGRARALAARLGPAISGEGGHNHTFHVACRVVEMVLTEEDAWEVLEGWNETCEPPWSEPELRHKLDDALKQNDLGARVGQGGQGMQPLPADLNAALDRESPGLDRWERHVLGIALAMDKSLRLEREAVMEAAPRRRGSATKKTGKQPTKVASPDKYAEHLLQLGLAGEVVRAQLGATADGKSGGETWIDSAFQRATSKASPTKPAGTSASWKMLQSAYDALLISLEEPARLWMEANLLPTPGMQLAPPAAGDPAVVTVVIARPGHGKTRGVIAHLALKHSVGTGRTGLCRSMVGELLHDEYAINVSYPDGVRDDLDRDLPQTHEALWQKLPQWVKEYADPFGSASSPQPRWTPEELRQTVAYPAGFHINSRHPDELDRRLEPFEDRDGNPDLQGYPRDHPRWTQPAAVLKFAGRPDLCLLGRSRADLRKPGTCSNCLALSCRANTTPGGGAKTYWARAAYGLLTHKAFETHAAIKPSLNKFEGVVFDELPSMVYRCPELMVAPLDVVGGRAVGWRVQPLDDLLATLKNCLEALDPNRLDHVRLRGHAAPLLQVLDTRVQKLKNKASDLLHKTSKDTVGRELVQADKVPPLLSVKDCRVLVKLSNIAPDMEPDDDDEDGDGEYKLLHGLTVLRDFCGDADLDIFMKVGSGRDGKWALRICRPVDGWPEVLLRQDGSVRPTVLLDATAGMDPKYLLAGQGSFEQVPSGEYPATSLVLTSWRPISKSKMTEQGARAVAEKLLQDVSPYLGQMVDPEYPSDLGPRILVVTAKKEMENPLRGALEALKSSGKLAAHVAVDHFGGLRGRNDYRNFDAAYLTHVHLYNDAYFFGLELLLRGFDQFDRQWVPKSKWYFGTRSMQLQFRTQVADLFQDSMRIGIRSDPLRRAFIFIPTAVPGHVVRLMRLFRGARLILPEGSQVDSPLPAAVRERPPEAGPSRVDDKDFGFGVPKHDP